MSSTDNTAPPRATSRVIGHVSAIVSFILGALAIYSAGFALIDPKLHRASVFALALIVAIAVARRSREQAGGEKQTTLVATFYSLSDVALLAGGLWAIYSFFVVQTEMEESLYSVTSADAIPAIVGLIVFLGLMTFPLWSNLVGGQADYRPDIETPAGETNCVKSGEYMRAAHMDVLVDWRDKVMRDGERRYVDDYGVERERSLTITCLGCHTNKAEFCDRCHDYLAVKPYCWECHVEPKGGQ